MAWDRQDAPHLALEAPSARGGLRSPLALLLPRSPGAGTSSSRDGPAAPGGASPRSLPRSPRTCRRPASRPDAAAAWPAPGAALRRALVASPAPVWGRRPKDDICALMPGPCSTKPQWSSTSLTGKLPSWMAWRKPREPASARGLHHSTTPGNGPGRADRPRSRRAARGDPPPGPRAGGRSARAQLRHRRGPVVAMLTTHQALLLRSHFSALHRAESPVKPTANPPCHPDHVAGQTASTCPASRGGTGRGARDSWQEGKVGERGRVLGSGSGPTRIPRVPKQRSRPASDEMPRLRA